MAQLVIDDPSADPVTSSGRLYVAPSRSDVRVRPLVDDGDPWGDAPSTPPALAKRGAKGAVSAPISSPDVDTNPWSDAPSTPPQGPTPSREVGSGEAIGRGLAHGITFGLEPAIAGARSAAQPDIDAIANSAAQNLGVNPEVAKAVLNHAAPLLTTLYGAGRTIYDKATAAGETPATKAYGEARSKEAQANAEASAQHPYSYGAAELAGAAAVPLPGSAIVKGATLAPRIARGVAEGAFGGGLYGAGNAVGEGQDAGEVAREAAKAAGAGAAFGGAISGAVGRRPVTGPSSGERAAQTAENLGAPLPKALSYDSKGAQAAGQLARQTPLTGHWIDEAAQKTMKAAEGKVESMAGELSPDVTRSGTDAAVKGAAERGVEFNQQAQNGLYDTLRQAINPDQLVPLPQTLAALQKIERERLAEGKSPAQARAGLEAAWKLATPSRPTPNPYNAKIVTLAPSGGSFNGVHRLRSEMRIPPTPVKPNPGYEAGDYNYVVSAMTRDLQNVVRQSARGNPKQAVKLFNAADKDFGVLADENKLLQKIVDAPGEGGISRLVNSAKEKNGFLEQLALFKKSVPPKDFERVSGIILSELGRGGNGDFTFAKFVNQWRQMSDPAKAILFRPEHRQWLDDIVQLAEHVKDADKLRNTSNTAGALITFDIIRAAGEMALAGGAGLLTGHEVISAVGGAGLGFTFGAFMASPARASSLSAWTRAYRGLTLNQPTPARIAAFRVATRNLAHNIGLPYNQVAGIIGDRMNSVESQGPPNE